MAVEWFLLLFRIPLSDFPSTPIHFYLYQKRSSYQTWSVSLLRKNEQVGHIIRNTDGFSFKKNNNQYSMLLLQKVVGWVLSKIRKSCFDGNFLRKIYASLICFVGSLQLLTQGSADVVLEACTDYWDGKSLCPVTASERYVYVRT